MNEIRKLSQDANLNAFSATSCGNYIVKDEIDKLSAKWDNLDEKFNGIYAQLMHKKASLIDQEPSTDDSGLADIYLEPLSNMEQKLKDLEVRSTDKSNMEISTTMNITRLTELITNFRSFDNLRQSLSTWINTAQSKIDVAKRNIDLMEDEDTLLQDDQTLTKLLQVYISGLVMQRH